MAGAHGRMTVGGCGIGGTVDRGGGLGLDDAARVQKWVRGSVRDGWGGWRWSAGDLLLYAPAVANRSPESADGNARAESALSGK